MTVIPVDACRLEWNHCILCSSVGESMCLVVKHAVVKYTLYALEE